MKINNKKTILKTTALFTWIMLISLTLTNATTLSDTVSDFTGSLSIVNPTTARGLYIDQNGNGFGLFVENAGTQHGMIISQDEVLSSSRHGLYVESNIAQISSPLVFFEQDNAASTQDTLFVQQDGTGEALDVWKAATTGNAAQIQNLGTGDGLFVDQNGNGIGLNIDSEATTKTSILINGEYTGTSSTGMVHIRNNGIQTTGEVLRVMQDNSGSSASAQIIQNDGIGNAILVNTVGTGLRINQAGEYIGLLVDSASTTEPAIQWDTNAGALSGRIGDYTSSTAGYYFRRNVASGATDGEVMLIANDNAGDDQNALEILNQGTGNGLLIDQNGEGVGLNIDSEATTQTSANIEGVQTSTDTMLIFNTAAMTNAGRATLRVSNTNAGTTQPIVLVTQEGSGNGVTIDQNGNGAGLHILNSGVSPSIQLSAHGGGIQMESPDGTIYCLTIANGGTTNVAAGACTA